MKEKISSPVGTGVIAIITILLVLVLAIFSTLTLSTAQADLALAQRGADTVTSYYEADGIARSLLHDFEGGEDETLEIIVPMNEFQGLRIHLERKDDGATAVLAWQTVLLDDFTSYAERPLPVWTGE